MDIHYPVITHSKLQSECNRVRTVNKKIAFIDIGDYPYTNLTASTLKEVADKSADHLVFIVAPKTAGNISAYAYHLITDHVYIYDDILYPKDHIKNLVEGFHPNLFFTFSKDNYDLLFEYIKEYGGTIGTL